MPEKHGKDCRCKECIRKWKQGVDISDDQINDFGEDICNGMTWRH